MKSVERVELSMFSSAAASRSLRIGREQRRRRLAVQHGPELPGQIVGVLHAAVEAAGAERRDQVRGVAGEDHRPMA